MTKKTMETPRKNLCFRAENLAVPEVITKDTENLELDDLDDLDDEELEEIQYETLAIPEFHASHRKAK